MAHTWSYLGDMVSDATHEMYYRGQRIREAYYRGEKIWGQSDEEVIFWDWTGKKLFSMTAKALLKLETFPDIHPDESWTEEKFGSYDEWWFHRGLVADGWTYTLEQAKEAVSINPYLDIAAVYRVRSPYTNSWGGTMFWVDATEAQRVKLNTSNCGRNVTINWGDGTTETVDQYIYHDYATTHDFTRSIPEHVYQEPGKYLISIEGVRNANGTTSVGGLVGGAFVIDFPGVSSFPKYIIVIAPFGYDLMFDSNNEGVPSPEFVQPIAIYAGANFRFNPFAFYRSKIRYVGMTRSSAHFMNDFMIHYTSSLGSYGFAIAGNGVFEECLYLDTITFSPVANPSLPNSFPLQAPNYKTINSYTMVSPANGAKNKFTGLTYAETRRDPILHFLAVHEGIWPTISSVSLRHLFLPYGWPGYWENAVQDLDYYYLDHNVTINGTLYNGRMYSNRISTLTRGGRGYASDPDKDAFNELAQKIPLFRLVLPPTALCPIARYIYGHNDYFGPNELIIASRTFEQLENFDSLVRAYSAYQYPYQLETSTINTSFKNNTQSIKVPKGTVEYYISVFPDGQELVDMEILKEV